MHIDVSDMVAFELHHFEVQARVVNANIDGYIRIARGGSTIHIAGAQLDDLEEVIYRLNREISKKVSEQEEWLRYIERREQLLAGVSE